MAIIYIFLLSLLLKLLSVYSLDGLGNIGYAVKSLYWKNTHTGGLDWGL